MKVKVTKEHITCGKKRDPRSCAIALALKDMGFVEAHVSSESIQVKCGETDETLGCETPEAARVFMRSFDGGLDPNPIVLTLTLTKWEGLL